MATPTLQQAMADLAAQVKANSDAEASAVQCIQGIAAQLKTALAAGDPATVEALVAQLQTSASSLGAAIVANTPAAAPAA